jgi:hypothetical protein
MDFYEVLEQVIESLWSYLVNSHEGQSGLIQVKRVRIFLSGLTP